MDERSRARVLALQALCLFDALGDSFVEDLDAFLRDDVNVAELGWERRPRNRVLALARSLALGAWAHHRQADEVLAEQVPNWPLERMQPVDRNILRLGLYELRECPETPYAVAISEAVALAEQFGGAESPAFVNGVLDGLRRASVGADRAPAGGKHE